MTHRFLVKWTSDEGKHSASGKCDIYGMSLSEGRQWLLRQLGVLESDVRMLEIVPADSPRAPWWRRWFGGAA